MRINTPATFCVDDPLALCLLRCTLLLCRQCGGPGPRLACVGNTMSQVCSISYTCLLHMNHTHALTRPAPLPRLCSRSLCRLSPSPLFGRWAARQIAQVDCARVAYRRTLPKSLLIYWVANEGCIQCSLFILHDHSWSVNVVKYAGC